MKRETFNRGIALLCAAFQQETSKETIKIYWETLKNYHDKDFEIAVSNIIRSKKWFPKIAEIVNELLPRNEIRTAAEEWNDLLRAAENGQEKPNVSETAMKALAVVGGYEQFRTTNYENLRYAFNKFESAYNTMKESNLERDRIGYGESELIGNIISGLIEKVD